LGGKGVTYAARLRVLAKGGAVSTEENRLVVRGADEVLLLLAAATDYKGFAGRQLSDPAGARLARNLRPAIAASELLNVSLRARGIEVPDAPVTEVMEVLKITAKHPAGSTKRPDNRWGYGLIQPIEALKILG